MSFLENAGYRQIDANAVKVNIVTLHLHAGVIIHPEEDVEMIRENERKAEARKRSVTSTHHSCDGISGWKKHHR